MKEKLIDSLIDFARSNPWIIFILIILAFFLLFSKNGNVQFFGKGNKIIEGDSTENVESDRRD